MLHNMITGGRRQKRVRTNNIQFLINLIWITLFTAIFDKVFKCISLENSNFKLSVWNWMTSSHNTSEPGWSQKFNSVISYCMICAQSKYAYKQGITQKHVFFLLLLYLICIVVTCVVKVMADCRGQHNQKVDAVHFAPEVSQPDQTIHLFENISKISSI